MSFPSFQRAHPVPLPELLMSPLVFRETLPALVGAPYASVAGLRDLAEFAGFGAGAFRTAMSRLRASGLVEVAEDGGGVPRYRPVGLAASIQRTAVAQLTRPPGFTIVVFSFSAGDTRERQVVREALRLHVFRKLAQNVYISGRVDTSTLEAMFAREQLADHVFVFHTDRDDDPALRRTLGALFDLDARAVTLRQLHDALYALLDDPAADDDTRVRRLLYAGPVHYRVSFVEEPPLPATALPADYPLAALVAIPGVWSAANAAKIDAYFRRMHR